MVCLIRPAPHAGLLRGLSWRLTEARPRRVPHSHLRLSADTVPAGGEAEVQRIREILAHAAQALGSSRNATGGRIRFRRFGLLDWLMSLELDEPDGARRSAELRAGLRARDVTQRFDDAITSVDQDVPVSGWLRLAARLIRLLPPLLFVLRVTGRVPLIGQQYRWFLRQPHLTPEVPGGFPGFAERLTGGADGWRQENAVQLTRLLTNAFLEDLRRAWRMPWRAGGPRRMTYAALLLDDVTADNGGATLLRLINHVRNEVGLFDPLLVVAAGEQAPLEGTRREIFCAENADRAYASWLRSLPEARRARTGSAWHLRIETPDAAGEDDDTWQVVAGLDHYAFARPPWWGRRIVPVGAVAVLLAAAVTGYSAWSDRHCGPAAGSTLAWMDDPCIGVTDGHYPFDPALADVSRTILDQNQDAEERHGENPERAYLTVVDLQALTRDDPSGLQPLIRVLIGNGGTNMTHGTTVATQLRDLPMTDAPLVGVIGLDHSTKGVDDTVLALALDGLPTIGASLSEDQLSDSNPLYYQVSPQNHREADVAAAFATRLRAANTIDDEIEVFTPDDENDTYAQNLTADVLDSFTKSGFRVRTVRFAPTNTPSAAVKPGILYPNQNGKNACGFPGLVYYAGDGMPDFSAFIEGFRNCPSPSALLADDDVTRYVADTAAREQTRSVPFWYTSFATAPTAASQGPAADFYNAGNGLYALFPHDKGENEDPSLDGHAALSYDAMQVLITSVQHLRLGNASIPITPGGVWREVLSIRSRTFVRWSRAR
ncbi:hypothetical protein [Amycolatopsis sp. GM8]|uniref:hypothetical protein n=1 Tax=Amycolatopsis sp. GM8 TaxID=2896530 RepID=UPI001F41BF3F|nr:hypothetical protein [Amycolatopsis sp. GM8]